MHIRHMAMQASSIDIITAGIIPCIRSIALIIVLHMSAQFMQAAEQSIICVAQTAHACSQAEHASKAACSSAMSVIAMSGMESMSFDILSTIIESMSHSSSSRAARQGACWAGYSGSEWAPGGCAKSQGCSGGSTPLGTAVIAARKSPRAAGVAWNG